MVTAERPPPPLSRPLCPFVTFSLPCPAEERRDRAALGCAWSQPTTICRCIYQQTHTNIYIYNVDSKLQGSLRAGPPAQLSDSKVCRGGHRACPSGGAGAASGRPGPGSADDTGSAAPPETGGPRAAAGPPLARHSPAPGRGRGGGRARSRPRGAAAAAAPAAPAGPAPRAVPAPAPPWLRPVT